MKIKDVRSENLAQVGFNGSFYGIVIPDKLIPLAEAEEQLLRKQDNNEYQMYTFDFNYKLVVQTEETTDEKFYDDLCEFIIKKEEQRTEEINGELQNYNVEISFGNVQTKGQRTAEAKSFYAIISFLAFYIALIFVMATATLLAIQQLSDSEKYKYRYELLKKLFEDEETIIFGYSVDNDIRYLGDTFKRYNLTPFEYIAFDIQRMMKYY